MPVTLDDTINDQWDYIFSILKAQTNWTLAGGPNSGPNPEALLPTVVMVGQSAWPTNFVNDLPFVGVDFDRAREQIIGAKQRHRVFSTFTIHAVVSVTMSGEESIGLDDAKKALRIIISDRVRAAGICHILRDSANRTLGGNAEDSQVTDISMGWDRAPTRAVSYIAFGVVTFTASQTIMTP